jgi:Domain of unknown function (DUF4129)
MRKLIYISVLLLGSFFGAQAQENVTDEDTSLPQKEVQVIQAPMEDVNIDTAVTYQAPAEATLEEPVDTSLYLNDIFFSYDTIKAWRNLKDYAYARTLDSLLRNLKKKKQGTGPQVSAPDTGIFTGFLGSGILQVLLWTAAICFVLFLLYRLFLADGAFKRKTKSMQDDAAVEEEIITQESDFDGLIRQALQNSNYRLALRYQYLRTLHLLAGRGMVSLAPDKTNFNYVSEINNPEYRNAFAALTLNYEYAWYGEFDVDRNIYEKIEQNFSSLNKKI